jgi:hypothetical protein
LILFPNAGQRGIGRAVAFISRHLQQRAYADTDNHPEAEIDIGTIYPLSDISVYGQNDEGG